MFTGTLFALAAGLMWGLVFIAPLMLPEYPAALLSFARYLAFVFEALAALAYAFILRRAVPASATLAGVTLLLAGVIWALRAKPMPLAAEAHAG